jgi:hypothetical protein
MSTPVLVLGRDGMGGGDEADFDAWVAFVCKRIDARAGFEVDVDVRGSRDVQSDEIVGGTDEEREIIDEAQEALWEEWCSAGAPGANQR